MKLSKYEQETIIKFNKAEDIVYNVGRILATNHQRIWAGSVLSSNRMGMWAI